MWQVAATIFRICVACCRHISTDKSSLLVDFPFSCDFINLSVLLLYMYMDTDFYISIEDAVYCMSSFYIVESFRLLCLLYDIYGATKFLSEEPFLSQIGH